MSLNRVGGKGDGGIDLQGWWWLPSRCLRATSWPQDTLISDGRTEGRVPLRVLAQCKAEEKKIGPRFIREFEGTILRFRTDDFAEDAAPDITVRDEGVRRDVVGVFVSTSAFTKASLLRAYSSPVPLILMHLPAPPSIASAAEHDPDAHVQDISPLGAVVFNPALSAVNGLLRGTVEPRWEWPPVSGDGRPGLWSNGERLESWTPVDGRDGVEEDRCVHWPAGSDRPHDYCISLS